MPRKKADTSKQAGTRYDKDVHPKLAQKVMLLGATLADLAKFLEVAPATVDRWIAAHPEFNAAVKAGGMEADMKVAKSLYRRAIGYKHRAVKIMSVAGPAGTGSSIEEVPYTEVYPPSEVACIFWLKNRQKDIWREKVQVSNDPDSPITFIMNMAGAEAAKSGKK